MFRIGAAIVWLASAGLLAGCSGSSAVVPGPSTVSTPDEGTSTVIPWISAAAPVTSRSPTPAPSGPVLVAPGVRPCTSGDVDYRANSQGYTGGQIGGFIQISNRSSSDCFVAGRPVAYFYDASNNTFPQDPRGADPAAGPAVLLPAGTPPIGADGKWPGRATLQVGWAANSDVCRQEIIKTAGVRLAFADGSVLDVPELRGSSCKGQISTGAFKPVEVPEPAVLRPSLKVGIEAPDQVRPGDELHYLVSLTDESNFSAWFGDQCPVYRADFNAQAVRLTRARQLGAEMLLNCTGLVRIAPAQTLWFEMRLQVPADATPGTWLIDWQLGGGFASLALGARKIEVVAP